MDGQRSSCNRNRIVVTVFCVLFLTALIGVPAYFHLSKDRGTTPCDEALSLPLTNATFHPDGSVSAGDVTYPPGYFYSATNATTRGCLCALRPCIRKCCDRDEVYVKEAGSPARCVKSTGPSVFENFTLPVHKSSDEEIKVDNDHFEVLYGDVCTHGKYMLSPHIHDSDKFYLFEDGTIRIPDVSGNLDASRYCLESIYGKEEVSAFVCFQKVDSDEETRVQLILYPIAMLISVPFLLATIVVYSILPALRNIHGKSLVCQCLCLTVTYIGIAIIQIQGDSISDMWCVIIAFINLYSFLGAFFWLNVMSFEIWCSVSGHRSARWSQGSNENKKFFLYSLYAWGMPFTIVGFGLAMDTIPGIPDTFIKPRFGEVNCWFGDWTATFLYFYLPCGIVLILNTLMFVSTSYKLKFQTRNNRDKVRLKLYLKLSILMGLNWILELISFFLGGPKSIWFVTDTCNALQGVIIFFFFVCRRDILKKLNKELCPQLNIFRETSPELSRSMSTHTKTDFDVIALNSQDNRSINNVTESKVT